MKSSTEILDELLRAARLSLGGCGSLHQIDIECARYQGRAYQAFADARMSASDTASAHEGLQRLSQEQKAQLAARLDEARRRVAA